MDPVIKTNNQILEESWYILDSREYKSGNFILPNVKVGEVNPKENLCVWKTQKMPLLLHLNEHNSHVYEVRIEDENDVICAIDEKGEDRTSEIGHSQYLEAHRPPLTVDEIINLISGTTSNSQKETKDVSSLVGCIVKKVRVIREILSVFYVAVYDNNKKEGDFVLPEDYLEGHPFSSLNKLKSALLKQKHFDGKIFKVYRGNFIAKTRNTGGMVTDIPLGEYITDTEALKKCDLSNEVQLFL